jgi:hypothetical protein
MEQKQNVTKEVAVLTRLRGTETQTKGKKY